MKIADVRVARARLIVAIGAAVAAAAILWLSRGFNFYFDEWSLILSAPDWTWMTYLQPHNEHPAMIPRLIYAAMLNTIGIRTYLPYMAVLMALHATTAFLLFEVVRRGAGDLTGIAAAALLLVLGAGWENLLWAFQISFVGSVACGLAMMLAIEARRIRLATLLVLGSLMFSGIGLVFLTIAAVRLVLDRERRSELWWLAPVVLAFGVWYLAFGHGGSAANPPAAGANLAVLPLYVAWGMASSVAGLIGLGGTPALLVLGAAVVGLGLAWRRQRPDAPAIAIAAGLVTFYVITGLSRAQLGYEQSAAGRYVYEGATLWLVLLGDAARLLPWRGTWRPALAACVFLACFSSGALLYTFAIAKTAQMQREDADLFALALVRRDHCLSQDGAVDLLVMPQLTHPAVYYRAVDQYGDPVAGRTRTSGPDFDQAVANLLRPGCG
jgi:hypothetical protein